MSGVLRSCLEWTLHLDESATLEEQSADQKTENVCGEWVVATHTNVRDHDLGGGGSDRATVPIS